MAYRPSVFVTAVRVRSISTSLEASTAAFATTAPEASLTTPEMVLCAHAVRGGHNKKPQRTITTNALRFVAQMRLIPGVLIGSPLLNAENGDSRSVARTGRSVEF